jgi:hypothetical protein
VDVDEAAEKLLEHLAEREEFSELAGWVKAPP